MDTANTILARRKAVWFEEDAGSLDELKAQMDQMRRSTDLPLAAEVQSDIPIYEGTAVKAASLDPNARLDLMAEWVTVFESGPGVIAIKGGVARDVVDDASKVFDSIIATERQTNAGGGDHFAKPGANDRIWNALQKHCLADPENFVRYYASEAIALAGEAWLGSGYQVTAQVNRVNPGGAAQTPHRDYHLGFMSTARACRFPAHIHALSPGLTLQGALAHCDMSIESGPTQLLPYSQAYLPGYIAFGRKEFQEYFQDNFVQLPLETGDLVFFNPAMMHAAGTNHTSDIHRLVNLFQLNSAFGRAIEAVDTKAMMKAVFPVLKDLARNKDLSPNEIDNVITTCAEGYSFPTNLDTDPPVGGLAPKTEVQILTDALENSLSDTDLLAEIEALRTRQQP